MKKRPLKIIAISAGVFTGAVLILGAIFWFNPGVVINTYLKPRITSAFAEANPYYAIQLGHLRYSFSENIFSCDSIALEAKDSSVSCSVAMFSVSGVEWFQLITGKGLASHYLATTIVEVNGIKVTLPRQQYQLLSERVRVSIPDSTLTIDRFEIQPLVDDREFFSTGKFSRTRVKATATQFRVSGVSSGELLDKKSHRARSAEVLDVSLDIIVDKQKPEQSSTSPLMPHEVLAAISSDLRLDSLMITNATFRYGEKFMARGKPALLSFDSLKITAENIVNHSDEPETAVIRARGEFMKRGTMTLAMYFPLARSEFSMRYSGSLNGMNLYALNPFLEIAEQNRITSGYLYTSSFDIGVRAGRATGTVRAAYKNLEIESIDRRTGSGDGIVNQLQTFIANRVIIRRDNLGRDMKIGKVNYVRKRNDPFFGYVWFALRTGVGDVVGLDIK